MKSWHLDRRTLLRASGISLALPWLEAMGATSANSQPPKRFCTIYFPYGVSLPGETHEDAQWRWFPNGEGRDYTFNESLKGLEPWRENLTVLGGLHHPNMVGGGGHDTSDTFLTGASFRSTNLRNTISLDQVMDAE